MIVNAENNPDIEKAFGPSRNSKKETTSSVSLSIFLNLIFSTEASFT